MFVLSVRRVECQQVKSGRRGAVVPWLILLFPVLLGCFSLAVHIASLYQRQLELQIASDAAALAGVNALSPLDDLLLFGTDPISNSTRDGIFDNAREVAIDYAGKNPVGGLNVHLDRNAANHPNGELVAGSMNDPFSLSAFDTSVTPAWNLYTPRYNAVQVAMVRTVQGVLSSQEVSARARAFLDRDVIGFKVQGTSHTGNLSSGFTLAGPDPAIPVAPLAIRTDLSNPPTDTGSWDYNIIFRHGHDDYSVASVSPVSGTDGVPEIEVLISESGGNPADNGRVVAVPSTNTIADAASQVATGITYAQLAAYDPDNRQLLLFNPATGSNQRTLSRVTPNKNQLANMRDALASALGQRRIWMLYDTSAMSDVHVVGFVVARVMHVEQHDRDVQNTAHCPPQSNSINCRRHLSVILQPSMLITCTAITDFSKRDLGPRTIFNPYLARARLVQ